MSRRKGLGQEDLELRLQAALEARAGAVGLNDLRRAVPPSAQSVRAFPVRRTALAVLGLAAALAAVVLLTPGEPRKQEPAGPPARPSVSHSRPAVTPRPAEVPAPRQAGPVGPSAETKVSAPGDVPTGLPPSSGTSDR